jgi:hypothetical protein
VVEGVHPCPLLHPSSRTISASSAVIDNTQNAPVQYPPKLSIESSKAFNQVNRINFQSQLSLGVNGEECWNVREDPFFEPCDPMSHLGFGVRHSQTECDTFPKK